MELTSLFASSGIVFLLTWLAGCLFSIPLLGTRSLPPLVAFFIRLATGHIAICSAWSLWFTGCCTIFIGVVTLYVAVVFLKRKEFAIQPFTSVLAADWKHLLTGMALLPLILLVLLYRNGWLDPEIIYASMQDHGIYTSLAEYLKITGVEVSSPWYQTFDVASDGVPKIYHYEDFWYLAFALDCRVGGTPLDGYNYIFTSGLALLNCFGNAAICISLNKHCEKKWWLLPLALACVMFSFGIEGLRWTNNFDVNTLCYPKIAALPIWVAFGLVARRFGLKYVDCLAFGALAIADIRFQPTILASAGLLLAWLWWKTKSREHAASLALLAGCTVLYYSFYLLFGSMDNSGGTIVPRGDEGWWFYFMKELVAAMVKHFVFFFPAYLALAYLFLKRKDQHAFRLEYFGLLLAMLGSSSIFTSVMHDNIEGFQFTVLVQVVISELMVMGCIVLLWFEREEVRWREIARRLLIALLLGQIVYGVLATTFWQPNRDSGVQKTFLAELAPKLKPLNKIGVGISNPVKENSFTMDPRICRYCNFLKQAGEGYWVNQLVLPATLEEIPYPERAKAVALSPFFRFIQKLKAEGSFTSVEAEQMEFIQTYDVDFVVVEKGATIPEPIRHCVESSLTDSYSGITVLFLYESCPKK